MARTEARIRCAVWRNRDFTSLPLDAQGLYWMLLSQPDVSLAGVVPHNPTRWAHLTSSEIAPALGPLRSGGFVLIDESTGELWIRTFARHDGVLASPKTRAGMWSAWHNILSPVIRGRFIEELDDEHLAEAHEKSWVSEGEVDQAGAEAQEALSDGVSGTAEDGVSGGVSLARADSDTDSDSDTSCVADAPPQSPRPPDLLFEAVTAACGIDQRTLTASGRGPLNRALKEIREVGGTPDDVPRRAAEFRRRFPEASLTPSALAKHWGSLAGGQTRARSSGSPPVIGSPEWEARERAERERAERLAGEA